MNNDTLERRLHAMERGLAEVQRMLRTQYLYPGKGGAVPATGTLKTITDGLVLYTYGSVQIKGATRQSTTIDIANIGMSFGPGICALSSTELLVYDARTTLAGDIVVGDRIVCFQLGTTTAQFDGGPTYSVYYPAWVH